MSCDDTIDEVTIIGFFPLTGEFEQIGKEVSNATKIARDIINEKEDTSIKLNVKIYDTKSSSAVAFEEFVSIFKDDSDIDEKTIIGVISPLISKNTDLIATSIGFYDKPLISYSNTGSKLENHIFNHDSGENTDRSMLRLVPGNDDQSRALVTLIDSYNWNNIGCVVNYSEADYGIDLFEHFKERMYDHNSEMFVNEIEYTPSSSRNITQAAEDLFTKITDSKYKYDVLIWFLYPNDMKDIFNVLSQDKDLIDLSEYVCICTDGCSQSNLVEKKDSPVVNSDILDLLNGFIGIRPHTGTGSKYLDLKVRYTNKNADNYYYNSNFDNSIKAINIYSSYAYDSLYIIYNAFTQLTKTEFSGNANSLLSKSNYSSLILDYILQNSFDGASGSVSFDSKTGNRENFRYEVVNFISDLSSFNSVGYIAKVDKEMKETPDYHIYFTKDIIWTTGTTQLPSIWYFSFIVSLA